MREAAAGDRLDQYQLVELVCRGGMASLFRAHDLESGAVVALKIPHFEFESDVIYHQRFQREEAVGLRLDHPGVVKVLKPRAKSRPYIAMTYVEGDSLRTVMNRVGPLPAERAVAITRQLCDALAYLHGSGVIHRDLKPDNIILTPDGGLRILDLGLARDRQARRITWGHKAKFGTPDYMAPERIAGKRGDASADVYAVGTMLYEMLTGHLPFESPDPHGQMYLKTTEAPRLPSYHCPTIDPGLEAVILRAIERVVQKRYASAAALVDALDAPAAPPLDQLGGPALARGGRRFLFPLAVAALMMGLGSLVVLTYRNADRRGGEAPLPAFSVRP